MGFQPTTITIRPSGAFTHGNPSQQWCDVRLIVQSAATQWTPIAQSSRTRVTPRRLRIANVLYVARSDTSSTQWVTNVQTIEQTHRSQRLRETHRYGILPTDKSAPGWTTLA